MLVYDLAHQLAREITETEEYRNLIKLRNEIHEVEANREMLVDFQKRQNELLKVHMAGETPAPEKVEELEKLMEVMMMNPVIRDYRLAEIRLIRVLGDIEKIIREAISPALMFQEDQ